MKPKKSKAVERLLLEFTLKPAETEEIELILSDDKGLRTEEYKDLVFDFYLYD